VDGFKRWGGHYGTDVVLVGKGPGGEGGGGGAVTKEKVVILFYVSCENHYA
jgi:hypothetical protein